MAKKTKSSNHQRSGNYWLHGMFEMYHIPLVLVDSISMGGYLQYGWISSVLVDIIGIGGNHWYEWISDCVDIETVY